MKFIGPDIKRIPPDTEKTPISAVVDDALADGWFRRVSRHGIPIVLEEVREFTCDRGGAFLVGEPQLSHNFGDWSFSGLLRHVEDLPDLCRKVRPADEWIGPHVWLPGRWVKGVLTPEKGEQLAAWLDSVLPAAIAEADKWWDERCPATKK